MCYFYIKIKINFDLLSIKLVSNQFKIWKNIMNSTELCYNGYKKYKIDKSKTKLKFQTTFNPYSTRELTLLFHGIK